MLGKDLLTYLAESPSMVSKADLHEVDDPCMINTMTDVRQSLEERTYEGKQFTAIRGYGRGKESDKVSFTFLFGVD